MGLLSKYQLLELLRDGETKSYLAEEIATRRQVYIHQIFGELRPPNEPDLPSLVFAFLRSAPAEQSRLFLDMGRDDFRVCVVTANEPQCLDLRDWLQSVAQPKVGVRQPSPPPPPPSVPRASGPSEAQLDGTQVFTSLGKTTPPTKVAMTSEVPPPPPAQQKGADEATGFTQAFFTVRPAATPAAPPNVGPDIPAAGAPKFDRTPTAKTVPLKPNQPAAAPVPESKQKDPGEFTKLFLAKDVLPQGFGEPEAPATVAPPIEKAPSSDFPFPSSQPPAAPASGSETAGSFTQMFFAKDVLADGAGAPKIPPASAPPIEKASSSDFPFPSSQPPAAPAPGPEEPGSFTQMFFAKNVLAEGGPAPSPQVKEPPAPAAKPYVVPPQTPAPQRPASPFAGSSTEETSPGEFTRMFQRGDARFGESAPAPSSQGFAGGEPAPARPREEREQGLKPGKLEGQPPPIAPVSQKPKEGGEITQFLSRSEKAAPPPKPVQPVPEPLPASRASSPAVPPGRSAAPSPSEQPPEPPPAATVALPRSALGIPPAPSASTGATGIFERAFQDSKGADRRPSTPAYESPSQPNVPRSGPPQQKEPGEFTRMMQGYKPGKEAEPATPFEAAKPPSPPPPPAGPSKGGSGDFTMMMQGYQPGKGAEPATPFEAAKPPSPPTPPAVGPGKSAPGDFTMMMQGYQPGKGVEPAPQFADAKSPSPLAPSTVEPSKSGPGEFTMIFRSDSAPKAPPPPISPPRPVVAPPPPPVPQPSGPGEYTRMFEISRKPAVAPMPGTTPPPVPAGAPPVPGMPSFALPAMPSAPPLPKPGFAPPAPPPAPKAPQFQAPKPPPPPALAPPAAPKLPSPELPAAAPAPKKGAFLVLVVVLGCSFLLAVALVLFFALHHH